MLANYRESAGQYRSDNGVVTGKTAGILVQEASGKCEN